MIIDQDTNGKLTETLDCILSQSLEVKFDTK